ncbi:DUF550 domain-containing protein, partial [Klebsiella aerogenes]
MVLPPSHDEIEELARMALDAMDRDQVRREHAEWSRATFGNVGPVGPLKHLSKEALEAAAEPGDLSEWADMQFLLWDAQRRAGITDEQITQAMIEKLAVNKQREWPEPKDGEPRLHIKAQPAPVVTEALQSIRSIVADPRRLPRRKEWVGGQQYSYVLLEEVEAIVEDALRSSMPQAEPVTTANKLPETQFKQVADLYEMQFDDGRTCAFHTDAEKAVQWLNTCDGNKVQEYVKLERLQEAVSGNSPVIPDGYVMVPKEPTAEMQSAGASAIRIETTAINKLWTGNAVF